LEVSLRDAAECVVDAAEHSSKDLWPRGSLWLVGEPPFERESPSSAFRSAHTVVSTPGTVNLRAVTQIAPGGFWVTADVRVSLA
jgi:hypothetical protein